MNNNKLIAYYCTKEWDTSLDLMVVQRRRVEERASKSGYEIICSFDCCDIDVAFKKAYEIGARVIVADISRIADNTSEFLKIAGDETKPFVLSDRRIPTGVTKQDMERLNFMMIPEVAVRQAFLSECKRWLS